MRPKSSISDRVGMRTRAKAVRRAVECLQDGDPRAFYETLTVSALRDSRVSLTLANPSLPDCPLVGISSGFEQMTGYTWLEIVGRNCRFLNRGCPMSAEVRHELRLACRSGKRFCQILVNRRKNGEVFKSLLHMSSLTVGGIMYLIGVQADITGDGARDAADFRAAVEREQEAELRRVVDGVYAASTDAWAAMQASNSGPRLGTPSSLISVPYAVTHLMTCADAPGYAQARDTFVSLPSMDERTAWPRLTYANTFIKVCDEESPGDSGNLRKVSSAPKLDALVQRSPSITCGLAQAALRSLTASALRDALLHLSGPPEGVSRRASEAESCDMDDDLKSRGSDQHPTGCTPCSFFCYSHAGCNRGQSCVYCHMEHPKRTRRRGKKKPKEAQSAALSEDGDDALQPLNELRLGEMEMSTFEPPTLSALHLAPLPLADFDPDEPTMGDFFDDSDFDLEFDFPSGPPQLARKNLAGQCGTEASLGSLGSASTMPSRQVSWETSTGGMPSRQVSPEVDGGC